MELMPAAKTGSKLKKTIRNTGEKFKLHIKVDAMPSYSHFSIREVEKLSKSNSSELQTSILDYYPKQ